MSLWCNQTQWTARWQWGGELDWNSLTVVETMAFPMPHSHFSYDTIFQPCTSADANINPISHATDDTTFHNSFSIIYCYKYNRIKSQHRSCCFLLCWRVKHIHHQCLQYDQVFVFWLILNRYLISLLNWDSPRRKCAQRELSQHSQALWTVALHRSQANISLPVYYCSANEQ